MALISLVLIQFPFPALATTTIDPVNKYAYGANIGWMDWSGDLANGAVIGASFCSGYIYSANVGWISLGSGIPVNGVQYQNLSADDFGVNNDGSGKLRGLAYGANIGWLNFENTGAPRVDLSTGKLSGFIYSANCGWISLSNAFAYVQSDALATGGNRLYTIVELGLLPGGRALVPKAVNNAGQIVGSSDNAPFDGLPVFWPDSASAPVQLATLGGYYGEAASINDAGLIVGNAYLAQGMAPTPHPALWTNSSAPPLDLGTLGPFYWPLAASINRFGQIVGHSSTPSNAVVPVFWADASSPPLEMTMLAGPQANGQGDARSINDSGQIVGYSGTPWFTHAAFWANSGGAPVDLGTAGWEDSFANAINNSGQIVGSAMASNNDLMPLYWPDGNSSPVPLAILGDYGEALAINASGQIVGYSYNRAVLWNNASSSPTDLNILLPANSPWVLQSANSINDAGEIVGTGTFGGQPRAFALMPSVWTLRITSIAKSGADLQLRFTSQEGHNYTVQSQTDLVNGSWSDLLTGIPGSYLITQTTLSNVVIAPQQFFRIKQE